VWLYYELTNFVLMASKSTEISFQHAMAEGRTDVRDTGTKYLCPDTGELRFLDRILSV
jgi:hypothetical protein